MPGKFAGSHSRLRWHNMPPYICNLNVTDGFTDTRNTCHRLLCAILVLPKKKVRFEDVFLYWWHTNQLFRVPSICSPLYMFVVFSHALGYVAPPIAWDAAQDIVQRWAPIVPAILVSQYTGTELEINTTTCRQWAAFSRMEFHEVDIETKQMVCKTSTIPLVSSASIPDMSGLPRALRVTTRITRVAEMWTAQLKNKQVSGHLGNYTSEGPDLGHQKTTARK